MSKMQVYSTEVFEAKKFTEGMATEVLYKFGSIIYTIEYEVYSNEYSQKCLSKLSWSTKEPNSGYIITDSLGYKSWIPDETFNSKFAIK